MHVLGAEHILDELIKKRNQVGEWVYEKDNDHQLVSAVCIQIKGDIQFNLGQWSRGAKLLLESLNRFRYCAKMKQIILLVISKVCRCCLLYTSPSPRDA